MTGVILAMTQSQHENLHRVLFPGDGLESAAILLCNQGRGLNHLRLILAEVVSLPPGRSIRTRMSVTWPFSDYLSPERISEIDRHSQVIITIHSHPDGSTSFSSVDNENDRTLFASMRHWFDDDRPVGSALMVPDGRVSARTYDTRDVFREASGVIVVGSNIRVWKSPRESDNTDYEVKLSQTFGKGTLATLRSLRVGVVGCSGTGSVLIELLARNCVGELVILDDDAVEERNLNRIINSTAESAMNKAAKVSVLKDSVEAMGMGTHVFPYRKLTDQGAAVRALIDCDIIFGAVDSALGRYHLDCLASAYYIPYFDTGVHLEVNGEGSIESADSVAHYVHPEGTSLLSRGAYTIQQVTAETYYRYNRDLYEQNRIAGYLAEVQEDQPAVMSVNMQAACMAFNDFLARIHQFRLDDNANFGTQRFRLVHGHYELEEDVSRPHPLFEPYVGKGDSSLLVRNNLTND